MFFEGIPDLLLVVHEFLLLVLLEDSAVDAEDEGGGVELVVVVVLGVGVFWGEGLALVFGAEEKLDVIFRSAGFEGLDGENVLLALDLAPPFPLYPFHSLTI